MAHCKPGDTIGIIGGGQLGRMMAMAAARLGFKVAILDPAADAPAFQCANTAIVAPYDDAEALGRLAANCAVVTYEFENVDVTAVQALEARINCAPGSNALATSQDRLVEKEFFQQLGIGTAPFAAISDTDSLTKTLEQFGGHGIVKTRRLGYDGKGQIRVSTDDLNSIESAAALITGTDCIVEGFVPFEREISIIAARGVSGEIATYDLVENEHRSGILHCSTVPAAASDAVSTNAKQIAEKVMRALDYVGVLAIEFFLLEDNTLLVNEFAPRVHNSGHWTEAACAISQFEQHIRAVAGLPLGAPERHSDCRMENLIGDDVHRASEIAHLPNTLLHLYGKAETRPGRKMGHFTTLKQKKA